MTKIKICGLKRQEDIVAVNQFLPDYIGFVFALGKRQITFEQAEELSSHLEATICPVGVFVNETTEKICEAVERKIIQMVQLHGNESLDQVSALKKVFGNTRIPIIKAISVSENKTFEEELKGWEESPVDYLLFDTGKGGTGQCFNHEILAQLLPVNKPWFLAGGMQEELVTKVRNRFQPYCIDVSSGVETDGYKDEKKIESIIRRVRYE